MYLPGVVNAVLTSFFVSIVAGGTIKEGATLLPCDDTEYQFSEMCRSVHWTPGTILDPRSEIKIWGEVTIPFSLNKGTVLVTFKVNNEPIYEDSVFFTCDMLKGIHLLAWLQCPINASTVIPLEYTTTDILSLKAYPGDYTIEVKVKTIDGHGFCCRTDLTILEGA